MKGAAHRTGLRGPQCRPRASREARESLSLSQGRRQDTGPWGLSDQAVSLPREQGELPRWLRIPARPPASTEPEAWGLGEPQIALP